MSINKFTPKERYVTQAEYDAIENKDIYSKYYILDASYLKIQYSADELTWSESILNARYFRISTDNGINWGASISIPQGTSIRILGDWANDIAYINDSYYTDIVTYNNVVYYCKLSHTSDSTNEPGVGANWETYWNILITGGTSSGSSEFTITYW